MPSGVSGHSFSIQILVQPAERLRWQRAAAHGVGGLLQLLHVRDAHQRGRDLRLADGEADRRLDQAAGESFIDEEGEALRLRHVIRIVRVGCDGIGRRCGVVVPGGRAAQRAAGEHAKRDHPCALLGGPVDEARVILEGEARRRRSARRRVDQVVADLDRVHPAQPDGGVQRGRLAEAVDAPETRLALLAQSLECPERRLHIVERHPAPARLALGHNRVVQLDEIDRIAAQSLQAGFDGAHHRARDVIKLGLLDHHFRADQDVRAQLGQHTTETALRLAVAVDGRGVEVVDAQLHGARDRPHHLPEIAAHQQSAGGAAAEAEGRDTQAGAA